MDAQLKASTLQEAKRAIRAFLQIAYSDEKLAMLLAHAQGGKLSYASCCCLIGIPTANHALKGVFGSGEHLIDGRALPGSAAAERAFSTLFMGLATMESTVGARDHARRLRLIPMVKAEMRRRSRLRAQTVAEREGGLCGAA